MRFDFFLCFLSGIMRTCATRKGRNWRAIMLLHHPGETDLLRNPLCCLRRWRMACLLRERLRSGWRPSWRTGRWTPWRTESNTHPTIGQETNGMKTWTFFYFATVSFSKQSYTCFISFFAGASTPLMTTPTVCVTLLKISHTHSVPKSFSPGICEFFPKFNCMHRTLSCRRTNTS